MTKMANAPNGTNTHLRIRGLAPFIIVLVGLLSLSPNAQADSLFQRLEGKWLADSGHSDTRLEDTMTWTTTLNGKFHMLNYRIWLPQDSGEAIRFEGIAYYRRDDSGELDAFWADSFGDLHPIVAERSSDSLLSHWGQEGGKQGRSRYKLLAADEVEVTDWIRVGDEWREFNRTTFRKR